MAERLKLNGFMAIRKYLAITLLFFCACNEKEKTYPIEPIISFVSIQFNEAPFQNATESLVLTFSFTDGDSDFGLNAEHVLPPYNQFFFIHKVTGELITSDQLYNDEISAEELITYSDRVNPPFDTLPERTEGCFYQEYSLNHSVYSIINENFSNIFVDFFYEDIDGNFVELDFLKTYCFNFDARVFTGSGTSGPFIRKMENSKKGKVQYTIQSLGFTSLFGDKKMKLKIAIQDRALHRSNIVETPEFYLSDI